MRCTFFTVLFFGRCLEETRFSWSVPTPTERQIWRCQEVSWRVKSGGLKKSLLVIQDLTWRKMMYLALDDLDVYNMGFIFSTFFHFQHDFFASFTDSDILLCPMISTTSSNYSKQKLTAVVQCLEMLRNYPSGTHVWYIITYIWLIFMADV